MDVVLVALSLPGAENHAVGALRTKLRSANISEAFIPFHGFARFEETLQSALRHNPRVIGLSLQTIESCIATLAYSRMLRTRGFTGRIVVGGHFATLNAEDLLRSNAGIDAVVRFAGEDALVAIARGALDDEAKALRVPGLVFRRPDGELRRGAPAQWTSPTVLRSAERLEPLPEHLGFPAADVVASRGCESHCGYCCIAAASDVARREVLHNGQTGGPYERRSTIALADEMAALYHEHGARVYNFMDDNVLPLEPDAVAKWAHDLRAKLDERRVGAIALSLQLRADAVSEASAKALSALGLVRAYVGVDGYSASQLRVLGRRAHAASGSTALALLSRHGIFCVVNALLVGPTIPFESVLQEIEGLSRIEHAPVHLLPIEVRAGTSYFRNAMRKGLVEGGFLHWHYRFADERTGRLAEILMSFPTRLEERSVPIALYDLGYNLGIARRFFAELDLAPHEATYARVAAEWNRDQLRLLAAAAEVAASPDGTSARSLVAGELIRVTALDRSLLEACDRALADIEAAVSRLRRRPALAHARGKLLGAVAFSMSLAACGGSTEGSENRESSTSGDASSNIDATSGGAGGASMNGGSGNSASGGLGGFGDAGSGGGFADGGASAAAGAGGVTLDGSSCSPLEPELGSRGYELNNCPCGLTSSQVAFDAEGRAVDFRLGDGSEFSPEMVACLRELFAPYCYPSLAGTTQPFFSHCWIA